MVFQCVLQNTLKKNDKKKAYRCQNTAEGTADLIHFAVSCLFQSYVKFYSMKLINSINTDIDNKNMQHILKFYMLQYKLIDLNLIQCILIYCADAMFPWCEKCSRLKQSLCLLNTLTQQGHGFIGSGSAP